MLFTLKTRSICRNLLLIFTLSVFFSCQKDLSIEDGGTVVTPPDLSTKVSSSVSGFVTDENNAPVKNAVVAMGTGTTSTDKYGYFEIKNVQVVKNAAFVSVSKTGYFKGIKTYMAKEGKAAFFRIKLLPKTITGTFSSTAGGTVTTSTGLSITLPANAVVNAATNVAYSGTVNIAARYIDPKDIEISKILPGGSIGINSDGAMKLLGDYGSAAIELTGSAGELLQVMPGKKATLVLPISATMSASAPASIPLLYLDETKGLWKQEGNATRSGNAYTGEVSHFSFWDWAALSSYVYFDCTIKDSIGNPVPNAFIIMEIVPGLNNISWAYTDENGYAGGLIPDNTQFNFRVFPGNYFYCYNPVYSQNIASTNVALSLGTVTMPMAQTAIISGNAVNCSNAPVTNGCIMEQLFGSYYRHTFSVSGSGSFSFPMLLCNNPQSVVLAAQDFSTNQYGNPVSYSIIPGNNAVGTITACGNTVDEFMHFSINSSSYSYDAPVSYFYTMGWPNMVQALAIKNIPNYYTAQADFTMQNIGPNSIQDLISFRPSEMNDSFLTINPIPVYITEYGNTGEYISGTFSGTMKSYYTPTNTFSVSCAFRMKRWF